MTGMKEQFDQAHSAFKAGQWQEALRGCEQLLATSEASSPELELVHLLQARCLVQLGQWMPAREAFAQTLRRNPGNYSAWLEAGHLCRQMGELHQASLSYQHAIDVAPQRYEALLGMARVMALQGEEATAMRAYQDAVQAAAQSSDAAQPGRAHHLMGQYWMEQGALTKAIPCFQSALQTLPADDINAMAEVRMDLAIALLRLDRRDAAMQLLTLSSGADAEPTLSRLTMLSFRNNLWQEAIEVARRNVALHPQSASACWNLAHLLAECWQMDEAEQVLAQAEALAPMPEARSLRAAVAGRTGDVDRTLALYLELAREAEQGGAYASSAAMSALYTDKLSPAEVAALHRELFAALGVGARDRASFVRAPLQGRRVRLGLVTADFHHQHPVNIFMQPVLRELDSSKFELFVYFTGDSHDAQTALARSRTEHWVEAASLNDTQLAKRIEADQVDVLLDLAGHTGQHRMRVFAQRAAPVQATYLGYPGSTGVPNMDFMLGDAVVTPEQDDALCSERVLRLPGTVFCYAPEEDYLFPKFTSAHARRPLTFASFNNVPKLTPHTLQLWARVLTAVPDSRLLLKAPSFTDESAVRLFSARLQALGVDLSRVEFRGPVGLTDMMAEYADVDIALDPVPYNGGTTSLQAMWMGVPVLCKHGGHFVSRMGASFMTAAGLGEWVAQSDDDYVAIAQRMAADRKALLALKKGLRKRLQALPAWDPRQHTRNFEAALLQMLA
jgi:protein O-GlcNAc transferase